LTLNFTFIIIEDMSTQTLPLVSIAVFLAVAAGARSVWQRLRFGSFGVVPFHGDGWRSVLLNVAAGLLLVLLGGDAVAAAFRPAWLAPLRLVDGGAALAWTGVAAVGVGLPLMLAAQLNMGASWRIGIDPDAKPGLVTDGIYRHSRNPIYAAGLVVVAGFVLLLPNALTLGLVAVALVSLHMQVRAEEAYLTRTYGDAYRAYARRVGRFVPGLGRLD
jgi:protein-S-isoprenylcysteine O-methyltransferase Ste14